MHFHLVTSDTKENKETNKVSGQYAVLRRGSRFETDEMNEPLKGTSVSWGRY